MNDFLNDIENCLKVLSEGGLILYPTDTVWGIGCDATNSSAVEKIYLLKKRPDQKSMIVLIANEKEITKYSANPDPAIFEYLHNNITPTTVIYKNAIALAVNLVNADGSIGMRIPNESFCQTLLKRFKKPLVSTSANLSGEPHAKTFAEVSPDIRNGVDYVVQYRQNDQRISPPSSIIRMGPDGKIDQLR